MKYISILRGINVGGHKKILMVDLKNLYKKLGFTQVVSYIQSGNVIFESEKYTWDTHIILLLFVLENTIDTPL